MLRRWGAWGLMLLLVSVSGPLMAMAQTATPEAGVSTAKGVVSDVDGIDLSGVVATASDCSFIQLGGEPLVVEEEVGEAVCGTIPVPENWANPHPGRMLSISYVVLKSFSANPQPDPVVYLEGGPGGSALSGVSSMAETFAVQRQTRDIVLFDQRGTTFSSPLVCSTFTIDEALSSFDAAAATDESATPEVGPTDLSPSGDTVGMMNDARDAVGDGTARCVRELLAKGVDLRQYNSIASANDTVALVNALGYETYNLYGISYGTRLALVLMRDHPEGIRTVVLDSTFPPEIHGFELYAREAEEVVLQVFADCRIDPVCNAAYPNLKDRFIALIDQLQQAPIETDDGRVVQARDVVEVMRNISFATNTAAYIPRMIAELEQGEIATYDLIVSGALFYLEGVPVEVIDGGTPVASPEGAVPVDEALATPDADVASITDEAEAASDEPPIDLIPNAGANGQPVTPAEAFIDSIQIRLGGLDPDRLDLAVGLLTTLDKMPHTAETLIGYVNAVFAGPEYDRERAVLLAEIDSLAPEDIAGVFAITAAEFDIIDIFTFGMSSSAFNAVECNEEMPFESFDTVVANAQGLEIPELAFGIPEQMAQLFATCEQWPGGRAPDIENEPVVSDIPTLVLAGEYDFQTPLSWNKQAFVNLSNAYFIAFPATGHGVIVPTDCAKDVAQQFLDQPFLTPDAGCSDELWPQWSMPGDPLPEVELPDSDWFS